MVFTAGQRSIVFALAYSHQFEWPLTFPELHQRLTTRIDDREVVATASDLTLLALQRNLDQLVSQGVVIQQGEFWALRGFDHTFKVRQRRQQQAQHKWQEVESFLSLISWIPWIKAVFVTGALAVNNVEGDEDVDFMIITRPQRLWLTRLLVSILAWSKGKRRSWQGEEKNSWCFNLWLSSDQLGVFAQRQSVYTAYELLQAQVVLDRGEIEAQLRQENEWVTRYLPHFPRLTAELSAGAGAATPSVTSSVLAWLDWLAYHFQRWYMQSHRTREVVSRSQAFFHPRETEKLVVSGWVRVLQSVADTLETKK